MPKSDDIMRKPREKRKVTEKASYNMTDTESKTENGVCKDAVYKNICGYGILYVLLKSTVTDAETKRERDSYSVFSALFGGGARLDSAYAYDITSEELTASEIFDAVAGGDVTPVSLLDVIGDILSAAEP